jgi:hypothetical protein
MQRALIAAAIAIALSSNSFAEPAAATVCPYAFTTNVNLAKNASFERCIGPQNGKGQFEPSAAVDWVMHSDNSAAPVSSECVVSHAPGPNGQTMLHFVAGGTEGGVIQFLPSPPKKVMFSAWVFVKKGFVQIQPHGGAGGPAAHSTKLGEWEQLRVCSDGTVATDAYLILNQAAGGGEFYVDRVEIKETP